MAKQYLQQKFSVFLSMTTRGSLDGVRQRLANHTVSCGQIPVSMELWPSSSQPVRDVIRGWLNNCDIFVQVLGTEYGTISQEGDLSYTELEFEEAARLEKPILSFILNEEEYEAARSKAPPEAAEQFARLDAFRRRVSDPNRRLFRYFSLQRPEQLDVDYLIAVQEQASSMHEGGWVREPEVRDALILNESIRRNEFFKRYVDRLKTFPILSQRTGDGKDEKEAIAQYFWDRYLSKFASWRMDRLFFESGSTLAYVGYEFSQRLRKPWVRRYIDETRRKGAASEFQILTNNILIYVDFALAEFDSDPMRIKRYPVGPADPYYGATFGELTSLIDLSAEHGNGDLGPEAQTTVDDLSRALDEKLSGKGLILMTASGLETDVESPFGGPHVGSYYNMLIKRALLQTRQPKVLFLHSSKIECGSFQPGKCFAVCAKSTGSWLEITERQPIAIASSAKTETSARKIKSHLQSCGLTYIESNWSDLMFDDDASRGVEPPEIVTIVAYNDRFRQLFHSTDERAANLDVGMGIAGVGLSNGAADRRRKKSVGQKNKAAVKATSRAATKDIER